MNTNYKKQIASWSLLDILCLRYLLLVIVSCIFTPHILTIYTKCQAVKAYQEFIEGKRNCMGQDILSFVTPTGESERRYATKYYIADSTGDGVPELHVWGHLCTVFTFDNNEMTILDSFCSSSAGMYYLIENGVMVYDEYVKNVFGNYYCYFILDEDGNRIEKLSFGWEDINDNYRFDNDDIYAFNGTACTMEEWFDETETYIYIDENGRELVRDEAEWIIYCEAE